MLSGALSAEPAEKADGALWPDAALRLEAAL